MTKKHYNIKHGMKGTRFYRIWVGMKTRCYNPKHPWYKHYGARGIVTCEEWKKFDNFMHDMLGTYNQHVTDFGEVNTSIDRINPDIGYNKQNCRWATKLEQSNNARNNIKITYQGQTKTLYEWCDIIGMSYSKLWQRIFALKLPLKIAFDKNHKRRLCGKYKKRKIV